MMKGPKDILVQPLPLQLKQTIWRLWWIFNADIKNKKNISDGGRKVSLL